MTALDLAADLAALRLSPATCDADGPSSLEISEGYWYLAAGRGTVVTGRPIFAAIGGFRRPVTSSKNAPFVAMPGTPNVTSDRSVRSKARSPYVVASLFLWLSLQGQRLADDDKR